MDYYGGMGAQMSTGQMIFMLAAMILMIASMWKIFEKAGEPGWASIIPIYNVIILFKIAGKPWWWLLLLLIPFVNFVIAIMAIHGVSTSFGKSGGYTVGLIFLGIIFFPLLAFGDAEYQGTKMF